MKNIIITCMLLSFTTMKCSDRTLKCSDCSDKESILKAVNKIVEKRLSDDINNYEIKIEEETDFYTIMYINHEYLNDSLKKGGGGFLITISKKDCKIINYKRLQ